MTTQQKPPDFVEGPNGQLAYRMREGAGPCVVWLGGFRSDMMGSKASHLDAWAVRNNRSFLRFDYSGHGKSAGKFANRCISDWKEDAAFLIEKLVDGPQILIGSSMGAWIAALVAKQSPKKIQGIIFIAPAPDFTERLMRPSFSEEQLEKLETDGKIFVPSDYGDEPDVITKKLIDDGLKNLVMSQSLTISCPVRILHGMRDDAVSVDHALAFARHIDGNDVTIHLKKAGDHRLSEPDDLARLTQTVEALSSK
ncbi:MAG: alpha/beta hydrolase [Pseudomonadota bacterium]